MEPNMNDERFLVSGWDEDLEDIDESRNPTDSRAKQLLEAAENGHLETIKTLLKEDPNLIHTTDNDNYTALHRACYGDHLDVVKFLVENGANLAAKTDMQWEPLHSCCQWGNVDCAAFLLHCGANVNALSEGAQTPLHIAAAHGTNYGMVQLLLMHPYVNPLIKNNNGDTAADIGQRSSQYYNVFDMCDPVLDSHNLNNSRDPRDQTLGNPLDTRKAKHGEFSGLPKSWSRGSRELLKARYNNRFVL